MTRHQEIVITLHIAEWMDTSWVHYIPLPSSFLWNQCHCMCCRGFKENSSSAFLCSTGLTSDRAHSFITSFHFMAAFLGVCHCVPLRALRSSLFLHQTKQLSKCASALSSTHSPAFSSKEKEGRKASQCQGHACSSEELGCSQGQAHRFLA